jgi:multidrug resistance efflux pump
MTDDRDPRVELDRVEQEIAQLRHSATELRQQVGSRSDGVVEPEEVAATIASAEELEAIVESLQSRREELMRRARG